MSVKIPRLVIAGLSGDSGKTVVSLSLISGLLRKGLSVSAFKKGPDYIDSAWLGKTAGTVCRNLDTYMVDPDDILKTFSRSALRTDISIIEGNRGIFDGKDLIGTHSTSGLAKLLQAPIVLVINVSKVTRTVAAIVNGCVSFDPDVRIAGVILNKVAGKRHQKIITDSIEKYCQVPVLGAIPKLGDDASLIPGRHLGLITPAEFDAEKNFSKLTEEISEKYLDIERLLKIARAASPLDGLVETDEKKEATVVKIGYFKDSVFTFYYPENLEALERNGAELVPVSSVDDECLPELDGLYIGGGFPEIQAERLVGNQSMMQSVKDASENNMPVYAECGGLIYLSHSLSWNDKSYPMAGVFPIDLKMNIKPSGHGYSEVTVDRDNPFFGAGTTIRGHEFHYSSLGTSSSEMQTCMAVNSGMGIGGGRDGMIYKNTLASYIHIHADGAKGWAPSFIRAALEYKNNRKGKIAGSACMAV
ncbi:MAG: cobyrinate a,c-diamide synthase [Candidatus Zixiibacteriota bacterium]